MPFVGYALYKLLTRQVSLTSPRRAWAAGLSAYVALNVGAQCAAIEFGLQPALFKAADGTPLYAPFRLGHTIPAMAVAHLTVGGIVEFALTLGVITFLQRANIPVLRINHPNVAVDGPVRAPRKLGWGWAFIGIGALVVLTPLGLLAPGGAFGEDTPANLDLGRYGLRAVPTGLARWSSWWNETVLDGYGFKSGQHPNLAYIVSALVGLAVISLVVLAAYVAVRLISKARTGVPEGAST
jgi:cobalt/nickel transport system permease protein